MGKRVFQRAELVDEHCEFKFISIQDDVIDELDDANRHYVVFRFEDTPVGTAYRATYKLGFGDCGERPWEFVDTVEAIECRSKEVTVTRWVDVDPIVY